MSSSTFDVQSKVFEIISKLSEYDSPDKIEVLKKELKFLQEWDTDNSITIVDFGNSIEDMINASSGTVVSYLFCFPGCIAGSIDGVNTNLRFIPVSTAFSGLTFDPSEFFNQGYFIGAYLQNVYFRSGNFTGADFTGADLTNANLTSAILTDAKIHSANFCGATLTNATLPDYADTIPEFKAVVGNGNWDKNTTWITGVKLT